MVLTTIAFKDGILASDTQITIGDIATLGRKIEKWADGSVVASCGNIMEGVKVQEWFLGTSKRKRFPEVKKSFDALMIDPEGKLWNIDWNLVKFEVTAPFIAIGRGASLAHGFMHIGLSAVDAVRATGELDLYTNTLVDYYNVKSKRLTLCKWPYEK